MSRLRKRPSGALLAGIAVVSMTAVATAQGPATLASAASGGTATGPHSATFMPSYVAPGTPAKYNKVGVIKIGPSSAKNVLVLEPGTSAGSSYFVPLAEWIVSKVPDWQVWSVERRENLFEDQSEFNLFKDGKSTPSQLFDYYLGYIKDSTITHHFQTIPNSTVEFAKDWGMNVAIQDLHTVIGAAEKLHGKVVLGGHSLGGSVVTAYATWDFNGSPGADQLAGLVYIDGASSPAPTAPGTGGAPIAMTAERATQELQALDAPSASPWLSFGGITAPFAGLFEATGSAAALLDPDAPSAGRVVGSCPPTSSRRSGSPTSASTATPSTWLRHPLLSQQPRGTSEKACRPRGRYTGGMARVPSRRSSGSPQCSPATGSRTRTEPNGTSRSV